ncbi:MAG: hypothetical protein DRP08_04415 [Candidatus Aenigmatarchaeota archaeon]|nr:MAG: hypothetical protein DRP08_04415 [Candidatus Aenigmarchaeota archaeon]
MKEQKNLAAGRRNMNEEEVRRRLVNIEGETFTDDLNRDKCPKESPNKALEEVPRLEDRERFRPSRYLAENKNDDILKAGFFKRFEEEPQFGNRERFVVLQKPASEFQMTYIDRVLESSILDENLTRQIAEILARKRWRRAIAAIEQGVRYIMSYLPDYSITLRKFYSSDPVIVVMAVYWKEDRRVYEMLCDLLQYPSIKEQESTFEIIVRKIREKIEEKK